VWLGGDGDLLVMGRTIPHHLGLRLKWKKENESEEVFKWIGS
jgi:hypothetical protein